MRRPTPALSSDPGARLVPGPEEQAATGFFFGVKCFDLLIKATVSFDTLALNPNVHR